MLAFFQSDSFFPLMLVFFFSQTPVFIWWLTKTIPSMKWFFFGFRLCPMECYQYFGLLPVGKPLYFVLMLFWLVLVIFWLNNPRDFFFQKAGNFSKSQGIYARTRNFIPLTDFFFQKPGNFSKSQGFISNVWFFFSRTVFFFKKQENFAKDEWFCQGS